MICIFASFPLYFMRNDRRKVRMAFSRVPGWHFLRVHILFSFAGEISPVVHPRCDYCCRCLKSSYFHF